MHCKEYLNKKIEIYLLLSIPSMIAQNKFNFPHLFNQIVPSLGLFPV